MLPWTLLGTSSIPGDTGEMRLYQRGSEFSIRVNSYELMNSRLHGSEDALSSLTAERLGERKRPRVLIGGLGMGFTLNAVLRDFGPEAEVEISELVPAVVAWHRGPLRAVSGEALDDPRVTVRETDIAEILRTEKAAYDAILLDVDNGPSGLTSRANDRLYTVAGLRTAHSALRPGGLLAVWSAGADPAFTRRLQQAGFAVEEVPVRGHRNSKGPRYLIWVARRA
jgi:spermidine synthase